MTTAECHNASAAQRAAARQKAARRHSTVCWYSLGCAAITPAGRSCRTIGERGAMHHVTAIIRYACAGLDCPSTARVLEQRKWPTAHLESSHTLVAPSLAALNRNIATLFLNNLDRDTHDLYVPVISPLEATKSLCRRPCGQQHLTHFPHTMWTPVQAPRCAERPNCCG